MSDTPSQLPVQATADAASYIRENGGCLYVWADDDGLEHARVRPPNHHVDFDTVNCEGFQFKVDRTIAPPSKTWNIVFHRLPFHHVEAIRDKEIGPLPFAG